jgi:hypothetical protein
VRVASEELSLLVDVEVARRVTDLLVRRAEDLDDRDQTDLPAAAPPDLQEGLPDSFSTVASRIFLQ